MWFPKRLRGDVTPDAHHGSDLVSIYPKMCICVQRCASAYVSIRILHQVFIHSVSVPGLAKTGFLFGAVLRAPCRKIL